MGGVPVGVIGNLNNSLDSLIESVLGLCIDEAVPRIQLIYTGNRKDSELMCPVLCFQKDCGMRCQIPFVQIILESRKHGSVTHVVTKDDEIVAVERAAVI